jgi:WD40 repeat protein
MKLLWVLISGCLLSCAGKAVTPEAPPAEAQEPREVAPLREACQLAEVERARVPALLHAGRLQRAARTLQAARTRCPELALNGWALELRTFGELGHQELLAERTREVQSSGDASPELRALAERWGAPAEKVEPNESIERGRRARAAGEPDWQRHFDRAVVALQAQTGQPPAFDAQNGYHLGISALAWQGNRLAVAAGDIHILDTDTFDVSYRLDDPGRSTHLLFRADGTQLLGGAGHAQVSVWDLTRREVSFQSTRLADPHAVRFAARGTEELRTVGRSVVWASTTETEEAESPAASLQGSAASSPDGTLAAVRDGTNIAIFRVKDSAAARALETPAPADVTLWTVAPPPPPVPPLPAFVLASEEGENGVGDFLAFSPDGKRLAAVAGDFFVTVFDIEKRTVITQLVHRGTVLGFAFSQDGTRLATAAWDNLARVWDVDSGRELHRFEHAKEVQAVAFSPDGTRLASGGADGRLIVSDIQTHAVVHEHAPHVARVDALEFSNDTLLTACNDGTVRVWTDLVGDQPEQRAFRWEVEDPGEVSLSSDGRWVAATSIHNALRVWSLRDGSVLFDAPARARFSMPSAFAKDGRSVLLGDEDGTIHLLELPSGKQLWAAAATGSLDLRSLAISYDQKTIAVGSRDHSLSLLDAESGQVRRRLEGHTWMVDQLFFTRDDSRILSLGGDVRLWDAKSGMLLMAYHGSSSLEAIALAPDEQAAMVRFGDGKASLVAFGKAVVRPFDFGELRPNSLAFSADGRWLGAATYWAELGIWAFPDGSPRLFAWPVIGLDAGYLVDDHGQVTFLGKDRELSMRHATCRFGDARVHFEVCRDFLER